AAPGHRRRAGGRPGAGGDRGRGGPGRRPRQGGVVRGDVQRHAGVAGGDHRAAGGAGVGGDRRRGRPDRPGQAPGRDGPVRGRQRPAGGGPRPAGGRLEQAEAAQGKPTTAGAGLAKEFQARLTVLTPRVKDALAAGGPQAQDLKLALSEAKVFARKQDFAQGMKTLDRVAALLQGGGAPPPPPPPPPDGARAGVVKRLNALTAGVKAALNGPDAARIQTLLMSVNGLIKNKDFAQAAKVLDELTPLVAVPPPPPPEPPASTLS